jgi:hypothetical protein
MPPISLRFKRKNETIFLVVEPSDSFRKIKLRLSEILKKGVDEIVLTASNREQILTDAAQVSDFPSLVKDDAVVYATIGAEPIDVKEPAMPKA